jgi:3-hydroxyacyl-CoA dehydrogenase
VLAELDRLGCRREHGTAVTRVAVLGDGAKAAQIGSEFALGGCSVCWFSDEVASSQQHVEEALRLASSYGLAGPAELERARSLITHAEPGTPPTGRLALIVEALPAPLDVKAAALAALAAAHPEALVATTGEAISVTALGEAAGAGERMLAMGYGDPPLLTPLVELLAARDTPPRLLDRVSQLLRAIGKRPVTLRREVPGMLAARLEVAMLSACLWLLDHGVADAEQIDEVVRDGLARAWSVVGPLQGATLRDGAALEHTALAIGQDPAPGVTPARLLEAAGEEPIAGLRERRDAALAATLRAEQSGARRPRQLDR